VGYLEYDGQGRITDVNRTDLEMLGFTAEEMIGRPVWTFNVEEEVAREQVRAKLAGALPPGVNLERTYRRKDGSTFPGLCQDRLILDETGRIKGIRCTIQDITKLKQAEEHKASLEEQLRQSQKMEAIGRLAGGIAHDFNNLLTVINGYIHLSLLDLAPDDPMKGNIDQIQGAANRASNLTRQLLAFSRRQILDPKVLDLNGVLRDLYQILRRVIGEDIELVTLLDENAGRVKADPGQIEQVIMNLAVNARDAIPNGGNLIIEIADVELDKEYARSHVSVKPGPYVRLTVSDTGVGMTPEVRERIFEPFFTTKESGKGTGLGLSTVYGIVKQSGGNIWVYSEPGHGTVFKIYLPRVDEPAAGREGEKMELKESPCGNERILLVEDEEAVRELAAEFLRRHGYTVLEAQDGEGALLICGDHRGPIDLLLTDVVMPGMSARELSERLVSLRPETKVLYMSGYTDDAIVHQGILEKGIDFIQKPFSLAGLAKRVREVLDKDSKPPS
jgi:PAS domain S-box-containing protein